MRKGTAKKVVKAADLKAGKPLDPEAVVAMSLRLDHSRYERLRKLSYDKHQPMTELLVRGIDLVLKAEKY